MFLTSKSGLKGCVYGQTAVQLSLGPMARDVESLALCLKALLCEHLFTLDPTVPPLPFREEVYRSSRPLRVGYYETDNYTMPSPAMRRALIETKQRLEAAGHTVWGLLCFRGVSYASSSQVPSFLAI